MSNHGGARPGSGPKRKWLKLRVGDRVLVARHPESSGEIYFEEWELVRQEDGGGLAILTPGALIVLWPAARSLDEIKGNDEKII